MPIVGANWNNTSNSGPSALNLNNPRTNANANIGLFSAYLLSQKGNVHGHFHSARKRKGIYPRSGGMYAPEKLKLLIIQLVPNRRPALPAKCKGLKGVTISTAPLCRKLEERSPPDGNICAMAGKSF
ncbi:hypothetical protein D3Z36_00875 [Lachnospiraceae bacterium]|nr:hypothetical protein [Lachnospiraceae bacterium]